MIIQVDNNEGKVRNAQGVIVGTHAYKFDSIASANVPYQVVVKSLNTGDYVVDRTGGLASEGPDCATIERKTLADLYKTASHDRQRFEKELERMRVFGFRAIMIEAEWFQILQPNDHLEHETRMNPKSMFASLIAWQQRFGVHIITAPGRELAERFTFRILERWFRDSAD